MFLIRCTQLDQTCFRTIFSICLTLVTFGKDQLFETSDHLFQGHLLLTWSLFRQRLFDKYCLKHKYSMTLSVTVSSVTELDASAKQSQETVKSILE